MPPTPPTASDYFGAMVAGYDSLIRRAVPRYDEMTDRLVAYLPTRATRILELGCGTGNLTLRLATKYPNAEITTTDASPEMTAITEARFTAMTQGAITRRSSQSPHPTHPPRRSDAPTSDPPSSLNVPLRPSGGCRGPDEVRQAGRGASEPHLKTHTTYFEKLSFARNSFDLITSCMSLHHVRNKASLYNNFANWLTPGGTLAFGDQLLGATPEIQNSYWNDWLAFCRLPGNCTEDEIRSLIDHANAHDHYEPLPAHAAMLSAAGFTHPDCPWRFLMYSVVTARRS